MPRRLLYFAAIAFGLLFSGPLPTQAREPVYPGMAWDADLHVPSARERLRVQKLTAILRAGDTTGMMVVVGGRVRFAYGRP